MRLKTLVKVLLSFGLVGLLAATVHFNQQPVVVRLGLWNPASIAMELWSVMMIAFGAGAGLILLFDIAGGARRFARNRRAQRLHRAHERAEDRYRLALRDLENGRAEQALGRLEEVLAREPQHVNALIRRGDCLRSLARYREAVASLEQAIRLAPDNLVSLYHLSDVYLETADWMRAEEILRRVVRLDPQTTVSAHRKLRDLKMRQKDWAAADELQSRLVSMLTVSAEKEEARAVTVGIRFQFGVDQLSRGELKNAIASLGTALEWDAGFVPAYCRLGQAHWEAGQVDQALQVWRKGYQKTRSPEVLQAIEEHYLDREEPEEAIALWKRAIIEAEDETPLRYCLGKLYLRLFMLDEALREFRWVEERVTSLPFLHVQIARILRGKGDLRGALGEVDELLGKLGEALMDYRCGGCQKRFPEWTDHCDRCGRWNNIHLDVRGEAVPEPTIRPAPTWSTP
jgi:tetratricopeptide (TPR) repeat protein